MPRILVIVPFPMSVEERAQRAAQAFAAFSSLLMWDRWSPLYMKTIAALGLDWRCARPAFAPNNKAIPEYRFERHCASVRWLDIPPDFDRLLDGKQEQQSFPRMLDLCIKCVEDDGTDLICLGSTTMHQAAAWLAERLPVRLINPGPLIYKWVQAMLAAAAELEATARGR